MRLSEWTTEKSALAADDQVTMYKLPGDLLLATWKVALCLVLLLLLLAMLKTHCGPFLIRQVTAGHKMECKIGHSIDETGHSRSQNIM